MKIMSRTLLTALLLSGTLSLQPVVRAAEITGTRDRTECMRGRLQEVAKELNVTDDQKEKLKLIIHAGMIKLMALHTDTSLTREQNIEKFNAIREEAGPQLKAILMPEQLEKWQKMRQELRETIGQRRRQPQSSAAGKDACLC